MPELPEVETVRRFLDKSISHSKIVNINIYVPKSIKNASQEDFKLKLIGQRIEHISRKGKHILFILDDYVLISHLRMEGKYFYQKVDDEINKKHLMMEFFLSNGMVLRYLDTRKFGTFHLIEKKQWEKNPLVTKIGKELFDEDITVNYLKQSWHKRKNATIKLVLLEQNIIAGIGNIYADEILFKAKILPTRKIHELCDLEYQAIIDAYREIMAHAIEHKGTTIATFHSQQGVSGNYQKFLKVYGRSKQKCFICGTEIKKIKLNGRGTHYCPSCQK
ncbi:hypothetical protein ASO20_02290 [Mycoplasma sp. (ex Biomphalaria glabrata)]|uniref:DNA-formamidopyrimidine glycosylase n=1 Tax=Mycoplasma sp. (ex Biomphalaria glabrata) TaxID=1749074 RepID=UPI00073A9B06|nr:DNA-formamidopyrimidine glycosylase [Mycoplasma sp. (ex Biomphalaria glabrata)]ALV23466.1 hypothetical protein ASO20_02290 [Mycoplasma sp. (ex Biomphalaria glabrata)]